MHQFTKQDAATLSPGGWSKNAAGNIVVGCPSCRNVLELEDVQVLRNGVVRPPLKCPFEGCNFHDAVRLDGFHGARQTKLPTEARADLNGAESVARQAAAALAAAKSASETNARTREVATGNLKVAEADCVDAARRRDQAKADVQAALKAAPGLADALATATAALEVATKAHEAAATAFEESISREVA